MTKYLYFPFFYLLHSRTRSKFLLISWQLIFFVPQLLITFYYLDTKTHIFIHLFIISFIIYYSIYEIGYLENDIQTIKFEKKPTIRLNKITYNYLEKNYKNIVNKKYVFAFLFFILFIFLDSIIQYNLNIKSFVCLLLLTRVIFFLHNSIRNRWTIVTFFLLSLSKYTFPLILFISFNNIKSSLFLALMLFPLLRTCELLILKRYNFNKLQKIIKDIDQFRIIYYSICSLFVLILFQYSFISSFDFFIYINILLYFLIFRIFCIFLIKFGFFKR